MPSASGAETTLRSLGEARGMRIGLTNDNLGTLPYENTAFREFDSLSIGSHLKMEFVHPCPPGWLLAENASVARWVTEPGDSCTNGSAEEEWEWEAADALVQYAQNYDMGVYGHVLIWHHQNPGWLTDTNLTMLQKQRIMDEHIKGTMRHFCTAFPGVIYAWDVVNEAIGTNGELWNGSPWYNSEWDTSLTGNNYMRRAFNSANFAANTAPCLGQDIQLSLNQHNWHDPDTAPAVRSVYNAFGNIDHVGMQQHIDLYYTTTSDPNASGSPLSYYDDSVIILNNARIPWTLTEVGVSLINNFGPASDLYAKQAVYYGYLVDKCVAYGCDGFTVWGSDDSGSWKWATLPEPDPMLFRDIREERYDPSTGLCFPTGTQFPVGVRFCKKPSYYAVFNALD
jgi:GH35 family endo-1,4-beta-xylanase